TPVPGGLELAEATYILREVVRAGKQIVGFDLNEVAPNLADEADEWDGNVGARLLYKLVAFTLASRGKANLLECRLPVAREQPVGHDAPRLFLTSRARHDRDVARV